MSHYLSPKTICRLCILALVFVGCTPKKTQVLLQPSQALGVVLAEETALAAGSNHQVAVISPDAHWGPVSDVEEAFRSAIKRKGFQVVTAKSANLGDPMSFRAGLKGTDFVDALNQSSEAGAVVSFCGAPLLQPADAARVSAGHPPVLVVATVTLGRQPGVPSDRLLLTNQLAAKIIQLAFVDGSNPVSPNTGQSDDTHGMFAQNYHILRLGD